MSLLETWRETAYKEQEADNQKKFWAEYFKEEQSVYEKLLEKPTETEEGTVAELAAKYDMELLKFIGFLDGINDSLVSPLNMDEIEETSPVKLEIDMEKLYYNMLQAKAEWLYTLPQWENILTLEKRKEITKEQRRSGTVYKEQQTGRNEPCPCGSGKKYKKCCGANV